MFLHSKGDDKQGEKSPQNGREEQMKQLTKDPFPQYTNRSEGFPTRGLGLRGQQSWELRVLGRGFTLVDIHRGLSPARRIESTNVMAFPLTLVKSWWRTRRQLGTIKLYWYARKYKNNLITNLNFGYNLVGGFKQAINRWFQSFRDTLQLWIQISPLSCIMKDVLKWKLNKSGEGDPSSRELCSKGLCWETVQAM